MLARKVIITVPLKVLQSSLITFHPSLPPAKLGAVQRLKMGNAVKVRSKGSM
jgi:monoamine oxidase